MAWFTDFSDKVVLVTGASSGIGRATAQAFGAAGAHVALAARRKELLEEVAASVHGDGGRALVVPTDVTRAGSVRRCFDVVRGHFGRVDLVINNAGVLIPVPVTHMKVSQLDAMMRVNVYGAMFVMQQAVAAMRRQGDGQIINLASLAGRRGVTPIGGYCASKFALIGLTEALRTELHSDNIHVSLVMPGVVETPMASDAAVHPEFEDFWPAALNMPTSWVVWAIFAAARFRLVEISVPPGSATVEKLVALAPGVGDSMVRWVGSALNWIASVVGDRPNESS